MSSDSAANDTPRLLALVVSLLLSVPFACGLLIAVAHVLNRKFVAPIYDGFATLTAFSCAVAASLLLDHWMPADLSSVAIVCWLLLGWRTRRALRVEHTVLATPAIRRGNTPATTLSGSRNCSRIRG